MMSRRASDGAAGSYGRGAYCSAHHVHLMHVVVPLLQLGESRLPFRQHGAGQCAGLCAGA